MFEKNTRTSEIRVKAGVRLVANIDKKRSLGIARLNDYHQTL